MIEIGKTSRIRTLSRLSLQSFRSRGRSTQGRRLLEERNESKTQVTVRSLLWTGYLAYHRTNFGSLLWRWNQEHRPPLHHLIYPPYYSRQFQDINIPVFQIFNDAPLITISKLTYPGYDSLLFDMETLQQQIQPFLTPLITRIEALEADNQVLKQTIQQLTNSNKPPTKVGGIGAVKPIVKPGVIKPVTVSTPVQPKPAIGIKKDPKIVPGIDKTPAVKVQRPATTADKHRPSLKPGDKEPKQPTTDRKEPNTKDPKNVVSPKPVVKGKEPPKAPTPAPGNKKPEPTKDPKDNKITSPKPADKAKVLTGGKQNTEAPKPQAKTEEVKQEPKKETIDTDVKNVILKQQEPPLVPEAPVVPETLVAAEVKEEPKQEVTQASTDLKTEEKEEGVVESKGDQALAKESADQNQKEVPEGEVEEVEKDVVEEEKKEQAPEDQDLL